MSDLNEAATAYADKPLGYTTIIGCDPCSPDYQVTCMRAIDTQIAEAFKAGAAWVAAEYRRILASGDPDQFLEFLKWAAK